MTQTLQTIAIDKLHESPFNTRRHINPIAYKEFAANIANQGVLMPLLVRPRLKNGELHADGYEIGAGHRRYKAAKQAGLKDVPCIVREMPDAEFIELIQIENLQREDVHPLDEANGYQLLIDKTGQSVKDIATKVSKDVSYIYKRLKLAELVKPAQDAFIADKISAAHAILISRLQPKEQNAALKECVSPYFAKSVRELEVWIDRTVHLDLAKAPFDTKDAKLVPSAGSCTVCPKRAGTQPELFDDIKKGDTCTHPACFRSKIDAHVKRLADKAKTAGRELVKISTSHQTPKPGVLSANDYQIATSSCPDTVTAMIAQTDRYDRDLVGATKRICTNKKCKKHWPHLARAKRTAVTPAQQRSTSQKRQADELAEPKALTATLKAYRKKPNLTVLEIKYLIENLRDGMCGLGGEAFDDALLPHFGFKEIGQFDRAVAKSNDKKRLTEYLFALALTVAVENRSYHIQFEDLAKQRGVNVPKLRAQILAEIKRKDQALAAAAKKDAAAKKKAQKPARPKSGHVSKKATPKRSKAKPHK